AFAHLRAAIPAELNRTQDDAARSAPIGILDIDKHLRLMIAATRFELASAKSLGKAARPSPPARAAAKQCLEKIARPSRIAFGISLAVLEAGVPSRRRPELLPRLEARADLIIGRALLRILQHVIGFANVLEARLGARCLVDVGMVLPGKLAIG